MACKEKVKAKIRVVVKEVEREEGGDGIEV
jgi:hypothetical protein